MKSDIPTSHTNGFFHQFLSTQLIFASCTFLIIAGIIAEGTSRIYGLEHLDRGYENFESKLKILGIKITREFSKKTLTNKEFKNSSDPADIPRYKAA